MRLRRGSSSLAAATALAMAASLLVLVIAGCCGLGKDPRRESAPGPAPRPSPSGGPLEPDQARVVGSTVELGTAAFPAGTKPDGAALHAWVAKGLKPPSHKLGYALAPGENRAIHEAFRKYARAVRFKPGDAGKFSWTPPRGCAGDLRCVLEELAGRSKDSVEPIAAVFKRRARDARLSSLELASIIVGFVQYIRYEIPRDEPFGLLPPSLVAYQKRGDCDSKALLGHMLLSEVGISSVILSSIAHKHAMLGIALPVPGKTHSHAGARYAYTECTAKGSPIGHINPELLRPDDWRVLPVALTRR